MVKPRRSSWWVVQPVVGGGNAGRLGSPAPQPPRARQRSTAADRARRAIATSLRSRASRRCGDLWPAHARIGAMRFSLLAALALAMLAGCDGRGESSTAPPGAAERERPETRVKNRLPSRLNGLSRLCANAASSEIALPVRCPSWLPRGAWGGRALGGGGCDYLFELHRRSAGRGGPYHAFVGGRCGNFSLRTRSGRWPVKAP